MGGTHSRSEPKSESTNVQNSSLESSSGLHLLEIHFPTLGAGMGLVVLGVIMLFLCMKRKRRNQHRPSMHHHDIPMMRPFHSLDYGPTMNPYPNYNYPSTCPNPRFKEITYEVQDEESVIPKRTKKTKKTEE